MNLKIVSTLLALMLLSCTRDNRVLVLEVETQLLEQAYPLNYPSTAPLPNAVVRVLAPQDVTILNDRYEKDYHVYRVRDSMGNKGYIIDRPGMRLKQE